MKTLHTVVRSIKIAAILLCGAVITLGAGFSPAKAAACQAPSTDYGQVTSNVTLPDSVTYRLWTRMMPADQSNKSFLLELDGTQCFTVTSNGGAGNWDWVDYQNGTATSKMDLPLTQGQHTIKLIGTQPGVKVDRIIFVSDQTCVPTGFGDNCNAATDITPPSVAITAPQEGATVSGTTVITADANDDTALAKVELYANSQLLATKTTAPFSAPWDTTAFANGAQRITAKAYDTTGNTSSDSYTVTVQNGGSDTSAPSAPTGVSANATAYNSVTVKWNASSDNAGVAGYFVYRNNAVLARIGNVTNYVDATVLPNTTYHYVIAAYDAAGNEGDNSADAAVTTPGPTTSDTQAPTTPNQLTAVAATSQQINLAWQASSDNVGVAGYDIYRATGSGSPQKVATVTTTSYGDTGLKANTAYTYYVTAKDSAGNTSGKSTTATATTPKATRKSRIVGTVSGSVIPNAQVEITVGGVKYVTTTNNVGHYVIRGVPQGQYNVTYSAGGHYSKTIHVVVADTTIRQDVQLRRK